MKTHHVDTSGGTDIFGVDIHYPNDLECVYDHRGLSHTVAVYIGLHKELPLSEEENKGEVWCPPHPEINAPTLADLPRKEWKGRFHDLKCWPGPFTAMMLGEKTFEYRKNDRDFQVGDVLILHEYCPEVSGLVMKNVGYTGRIHVWRITHIIGLNPADGAFGIPEGYCIMSLARVTEGWE